MLICKMLYLPTPLQRLCKNLIRTLMYTKVKAQNTNCKIVLVEDENTEKKLVDKVRQVKKDGLIDNFIYSSVSSPYFSAVIDAL